MRPKKTGFRLFHIPLILIGIPVAGFLFFLILLSATEFNPTSEMTLSVENPVSLTLSQGDTLSVMTWNIGFGSLHEGADFFMDGGTMVSPADAAQVMTDLEGMASTLHQYSPDVIYFQEIDRRATRSHKIDQIRYLTDALTGYEYAYAINYKAVFIPYPLPPIGQVESGIVTMSRFAQTQAVRYPLTCPFSWPVRLGNLKRCLLITRIPVEGTDKELVLINLHLDAYDDGSGRAAQTLQLKTVLEEEYRQGNYVICGGDFNQVFSNVDMSAYPSYEGMWQASYIDADSHFAHYHCVMDERIPTCRSLDQPYRGADHDTFQYYMVDGYIISDNLEVEELKTLDEGFVYSDHNPVLIRIRIP